jgi:AraC family transcriptional regulator
MNPLHNLNQALDYIEDHLDEEIDLVEVARRACCSQYQFVRTFTFLAGISVSEYVRRRRMTLAAAELRQGRARVLDVAVKYGYSSSDAFARAFAAVHGVMPSQSRTAQLNAYPRLSFQLTVQGGEKMQYRMESKEAFRVVGIHGRVRLIYEGINPEIAAMFASLDPDTIATMKKLSNTEPRGVIQATDNPGESYEEGSSLEHYIGAATTHPCPEGMACLEIPAGEWAVFPTQGPFPKTMQDVWARIYTEWFPSSGYQHAGGPSLVWSESPDISSPTFRNEIWIPVKPLGA